MAETEENPQIDETRLQAIRRRIEEVAGDAPQLAKLALEQMVEVPLQFAVRRRVLRPRCWGLQSEAMSGMTTGTGTGTGTGPSR